MTEYKRPYLKQKPVLYFDENYPEQVIRELKKDKHFLRNFKIYSVHDFNNQGQDDNFQYSFCKKRGFVLVTLDGGFMNDKKFPILKIPGIIFIATDKNCFSKIKQCLIILTEFLSYFPRPKTFMGDSKFQVSLEGCIMRGRDSRTREIKTVTIMRGDTLSKIAKAFSYF